MIAFASRTGNVSYIVSKLNLPNVEITDGLVMSEAFLLCTYTDGLGEVPAIVAAFMKRNHTYCRGIVVSGNSNFGHHVFGQAGDVLSKQYHIPVVCKLDLRGYANDYERITTFYYEQFREVTS